MPTDADDSPYGEGAKLVEVVPTEYHWGVKFHPTGRLALLLTVGLVGCGNPNSTNDSPTYPVGRPAADGDGDVVLGDPHGPGDDQALGDAGWPADPQSQGDASAGDASPQLTCTDLPPTGDTLHLGRQSTVDVLTWNLHNFPARSTTVTELSALVGRIDPDLIALQEVADVSPFADLLAALPAYEGRYSPDTYSNGTYQKTAYLWRRALFSLVDTASLFGGNSYAFPRPPFQASFDIATCDGSPARVTFINVHLKASAGDPADDEESEARRRAAIEALKIYTDGLLQTGVSKVVVLGDYNDTLSAPTDDYVFTAYSNDPVHYTLATATLDTGTEYTYIPFPHFLDHLLVSSALTPALRHDDTQVLHLDELITTYTYTSVISDHRPVLMQLNRDDL